MSAQPYHKRYHSDALAGFMPLTLEERGAFQTLLDMIYDRGGPIDDNERLLAGYMNCSIRKWRLVRDSLLKKGKIFVNENGMISNSRAIFELENSTKTQRKLIESGAKGGRTRAENEKKANDNNETNQASLEPALSDPQAIPDTRYQIPDNTYLPISSTETARDDGQAGRAEDLTQELAGMVGLQLVTAQAITANVATVQTWLEDGIEAETCRTVIRTCVANGGGADTRSLRRFDAVVRHDHAKRGGKQAEPPAKPLPIAEQIRYFEEQAARAERIGQADTAAEWLSKAEKLKLGIAA